MKLKETKTMKTEYQPKTPIPFAQWNEYFPWPVGPRGLRHIAGTNPEFKQAFMKVGGVSLVDPVRFWDVVYSHGERSDSETVNG